MIGTVTTYSLRQPHIDWLLRNGVPPEAIIKPVPVELTRGTKAADGIFEHDPEAPEWFLIEEEADAVFWRPKTGEIATELGTAFALGAEDIGNPGVTALGGWLQIHADPLDWLRNNRRGIFVVRWEWAFEQLRDVTRIAVAESILETYQAHMRPPHMPEIGVVPSSQRRAS